MGGSVRTMVSLMPSDKAVRTTSNAVTDTNATDRSAVRRRAWMRLRTAMMKYMRIAGYSLVCMATTG